ncbi:MAG: DNA repair protein RecO [Chloroflexi bacterium]|nr:DNA repair protein RecO [Chloroflexota bacterium]
MDFTDDAYVLSARPFGETGAIVEALTAVHGRWAAHVAGGASRKLKPLLQPGARVQFAYRSRTSDQLGSATVEAAGPGPDALFDDRLALAGLASAAALAQALPEREAHPGAFLALEALISALTHSDIWPAVYVRFEAGLLEEVGFGLDLSRCAATGSRDDLVYVSPRTGRAVSREAGRPYHDKLLALPPFLLSSQGGLSEGDIAAGLALTGHFLEQFVFAPLNRPLPPPRHWLLERLRDAGAL